ncbi:hypothetical protein KUA04_17210 [Proteus mirabilis]|uniref:hypothetical protein n=1 Tax=Proteus mirabilis TaxID=584 RepID=UPI002181FBBF|nr:hypothetical protein [Proteus mirabilis]MCT0090159.1 hypothetical protein [Proteus mirabilis]HEK3221748.1 hypothetical protein [Proteus mirabilis]
MTIDDTGKGLENENIYYHDMSGRCLALGKIALGQKVFYQDEGFTVYRTTNNLFLVESAEGDYQLFEANPHKINTLRLMKTGVLNPNSQGKVYVTDILMTPDDVTRNLLINNPKYLGRGDYALYLKLIQCN